MLNRYNSSAPRAGFGAERQSGFFREGGKGMNDTDMECQTETPQLKRLTEMSRTSG
jgi:hypothetical protein